MCDKFVLSGQAANGPQLRKLNLSNIKVFFHLDSLKMKNAICPVYRDTQLPRSNFRFWDLFCLLISLSQYKPRRFGKPCYRKTWQFHSHLKITAPNKGGIVYCLLQPDYFLIGPKVYGSKFIPTYKTLRHPDCSCYRDKVNRLQADAQLSLFLQSHLDNFIVTWQILPTYRD